MTAAPRVLVVGDVIDDVLVRPHDSVRVDTDTPSSIVTRPGGSAANTACWLGAADVDVTFVGTVHHDDIQRHDTALRAHGVRPMLHGSTTSTGTIVLLIDGEHRTMLTDRGANDLTGPHLLTDELLRGHTHLHLTGYSLFGRAGDAGWHDALRRASTAGLTVSVDPSSAGYLQTSGARRFGAVVAGVDLLLPNLAEARLLAEGHDAGHATASDAAVRLTLGHHLVVVKSGAAGAVAASADGTRAGVAAVPTRLVDPTGAGDAFDAGFLEVWLHGGDLGDALLRGAATASRAIETVGARPA